MSLDDQNLTQFNFPHEHCLYHHVSVKKLVILNFVLPRMIYFPCRSYQPLNFLEESNSCFCKFMSLALSFFMSLVLFIYSFIFFYV